LKVDLNILKFIHRKKLIQILLCVKSHPF